MNIYYPDASHFLSELGAVEEWTETYIWYVEGVPQASDNAMQKERLQCFGLCPKAGWRGEEYMG